MEECDPTEVERATAFAEIKAWAESLGEDDYRPAIVLDLIGKKFTLDELVEDLKEGTALAEVLLDFSIVRAKEQGVSSVEYLKKIMKTATGEVVKGKFWLEGGAR